MRKKPIGLLILIIIIGAVIGSVLGELLAFLLPSGVVKQFFLRSAIIGFDPFSLDLGVIQFTFGFKLILNVIGIVGIAFAAYVLRWYNRNRV